MDRREFLAAGMGGALTTITSTGGPAQQPGSHRELFPGIGGRAFLNAASGTPLGSFAESGLRRFEGWWRAGHDAWGDMTKTVEEARAAFARLVAAKPGEIALVHCTKAGEQIVLDGLPALRKGGNVVTNDLHFSGSLHNLVGLRRAGLDVRIVRSKDWRTSLDRMASAIDGNTALVSVTYVSNVNGHVEPLAELSELAHAHGALVYADLIQAAGIVPIDVGDLGIDFAACSAYKWLYGTHGVGFLFVREELQGRALPDSLFPGRARHNYAPWVDAPDPAGDDFLYRAPEDASRYQPGHVGYLGYSALAESLAFLESVGIEKALAHSVQLNRRLVEQLDPGRYPCISPHLERSPIVTFRVHEPERIEEALESAGVVVTLGSGRLRVSPALYNDGSDVDRLAEALNRA